MSEPRFSRPTQLDDALALLEDEGAFPLAGGVSLVLLMNLGFSAPDHLVSLAGIPELSGVHLHHDHVTVGAMTTHTALATDLGLADACPGLAGAFRGIGNIRVRNVGTLGGNLAHADPAQDPPVALAALDAEATVRGPSGIRQIAVAALAAGPLEPSIAEDELIVSVRIPRTPVDRSFRYVKFLPSTQDDYATVSLAGCIGLDAAGTVTHLRIAAGSVGPTPLVLRDSAAPLLGHALDEDVIEACALRARGEVFPTSDRRGSADYKRAMVASLLGRMLREAREARR